MFPIKTTPKTAPSKRTAFGRALDRLRASRRPARKARICFIIDATGSRAEGWEQAQGAQGKMFSAVAAHGGMALRLLHYGGGILTPHEYCEDASLIARRMAGVRCQRGLTQILPALHSAAECDPKPDAIILVGDAFEEDSEQLAQMLPSLRASGIRVFCFFEGQDCAAEFVFRELAEETGGKFARLGDDMPLNDLCEGVAMLASGGERAIKRLKNERARRLLLSAPSK